MANKEEEREGEREVADGREEKGERRRKEKKKVNESWPLDEIGGPGFICGEIRGPLREERIRVQLRGPPIFFFLELFICMYN